MKRRAVTAADAVDNAVRADASDDIFCHDFDAYLDASLPASCSIASASSSSSSSNSSNNRGRLASWTQLNMSRRALPRLSPLVALRYSALTALLLNDNMLTTLPTSCERLRHLRVLDLANNRLRAVPPCVPLIVSLRTLRLQNNRIQALPLGLGRLCRLVTLLLDEERVASVPRSVVAQGTRAIVEWLRERMPPPPHPVPRRMIPLAPTTALPSLTSSSLAPFTVFCYNVRLSFTACFLIGFSFFRRFLFFKKSLSRSLFVILIRVDFG